MTTFQKSFRERPFETPESKRKDVFLLAIILIIVGSSLLAWWYVRIPLSTSLTNDTIREALVGAERAIIELDLGVGRLQLGAGSPDQMIEGHIQTLAGIETFERTATAQDNAMTYTFISSAPSAVREPLRWPQWNLSLNPNVPLELSIRGGMGDSNLDLSKLNLRNFSLDSASGRYNVILPEHGHINVVIKGGQGRTTIKLPENVAISLQMQVRGTGHIDYNGRIYRQNASFKSKDFELANNRISLQVTSGSAHVIID
jgi:hypothetical protein